MSQSPKRDTEVHRESEVIFTNASPGSRSADDKSPANLPISPAANKVSEISENVAKRETFMDEDEGKTDAFEDVTKRTTFCEDDASVFSDISPTKANVRRGIYSLMVWIAIFAVMTIVSLGYAGYLIVKRFSGDKQPGVDPVVEVNPKIKGQVTTSSIATQPDKRSVRSSGTPVARNTETDGAKVSGPMQTSLTLLTSNEPSVRRVSSSARKAALSTIETTNFRDSVHKWKPKRNTASFTTQSNDADTVLSSVQQHNALPIVNEESELTTNEDINALIPGRHQAFLARSDDKPDRKFHRNHHGKPLVTDATDEEEAADEFEILRPTKFQPNSVFIRKDGKIVNSKVTKANGRVSRLANFFKSNDEGHSEDEAYTSSAEEADEPEHGTESDRRVSSSDSLESRPHTRGRSSGSLNEKTEKSNEDSDLPERVQDVGKNDEKDEKKSEQDYGIYAKIAEIRNWVSCLGQYFPRRRKPTSVVQTQKTSVKANSDEKVETPKQEGGISAGENFSRTQDEDDLSKKSSTSLISDKDDAEEVHHLSSSLHTIFEEQGDEIHEQADEKPDAGTEDGLHTEEIIDSPEARPAHWSSYVTGPLKRLGACVGQLCPTFHRKSDAAPDATSNEASLVDPFEHHTSAGTSDAIEETNERVLESLSKSTSTLSSAASSLKSPTSSLNSPTPSLRPSTTSLKASTSPSKASTTSLNSPTPSLDSSSELSTSLMSDRDENAAAVGHLASSTSSLGRQKLRQSNGALTNISELQSSLESSSISPKYNDDVETDDNVRKWVQKLGKNIDGTNQAPQTKGGLRARVGRLGNWVAATAYGLVSRGKTDEKREVVGNPVSVSNESPEVQNESAEFHNDQAKVHQDLSSSSASLLTGNPVTESGLRTSTVSHSVKKHEDVQSFGVQNRARFDGLMSDVRPGQEEHDTQVPTSDTPVQSPQNAEAGSEQPRSTASLSSLSASSSSILDTQDEKRNDERAISTSSLSATQSGITTFDKSYQMDTENAARTSRIVRTSRAGLSQGSLSGDAMTNSLKSLGENVGTQMQEISATVEEMEGEEDSVPPNQGLYRKIVGLKDWFGGLRGNFMRRREPISENEA